MATPWANEPSGPFSIRSRVGKGGGDRQSRIEGVRLVGVNSNNVTHGVFVKLMPRAVSDLPQHTGAN